MKKNLPKPKKDIDKSVGSNNTNRQWVELGKTILLGIIGSIAAYYLVEYLMEPKMKEVFSYYYTLHTIPIDIKAKETSVTELNDMLSIVIKPDNALNINNIKIHGISKIFKLSTYCSENDINKGLNQKVTIDHNKDVAAATITGLPTIPAKSKLIINVWGIVNDDSCNPVIIKEDNTMVWPTESKLVAESYLFLARYWQLVLAINILIMISIYYFIKIKARS